MNLSMALEEKSDLFSFVPFSPIHIEIDRIASECFAHMLQHLEESLPVALRGSYQSLPPQQGCHPTGQIEPLTVLAGGRHFEALPLLGPASSQTGMKAKTGFILKNDGFIGFEVAQFFLIPCENGGHPWREPEDKHSLPVSDCNLSDAASIAPGALSALCQNASSNELPAWGHPKQPLTDQIPEESFPDVALAVASLPASIESHGLGGDPVLKSEFPPDSLHVSSVPESCDLDLKKRLSIPDAGPPKPAIRRRPLSQSRLPGLALPGLLDFRGWLRSASNLRLSRYKYSILMQHLLVRLY